MLWLERAWRAFWPLASWCLLCLGLSFIVFDRPPVSIALGIGVAIALLILGLYRLNRPTLPEAIERVDRPLKGRPLYSLMDQSVLGDADLWQMQQSRLQVIASGARVHWGHFQIAKLDPFGLRLIAMLVCLVGLLFGTSPVSLGGRVPAQLAADGGMGATWEGWIIPPDFTGKPTIYLADVLDQPNLQVFQSSVIELRSYGPETDWVDQTLSETNPSSSAIQRITVDQDGRLSITAAPEKTWNILLEQDQPPSVELTSEFSGEFFGTSTLSYAAQDDFGITKGRLLITLDDPLLDRRFGLVPEYQGEKTLIEAISLPVSARKTDIKDVITQDFSQSVFAHLPVRVVLEVQDSAGGIGTSDPFFTRLPARKFFDPLAKSLIEIRRDLLWSSANDTRALRVMRAILYQPQSEFRRETHYLLLRNIADRWDTALLMTSTDQSRDTIAADLWDLAIAIEEGDVDDALERMREAQERLSEAIKNGATPEEIEKLMQDLKAANDNYLRQQRQQAERDFAEMTPEERSMMRENETLTMNADDLQAMMDRIQELMENGQMAEALQALQEYQEMIENMQTAQSESGGEGGNPAETMDDLANTLREQQELSDQSFDQLQDQFNGQEGNGSPEGLADRQSDLQDQLEAQRGRAPQLDGKAARDAQKALRDAQEAMRQAEEALRDGEFGDALDQQSQAMDTLREGIKNFDQAMAENSEDAGGENQENAGGERSDPLGRSQGENGQNGVSDTQVGSAESDKKKSEIINEIRRRSGELERSEKERDYLKRLLDRF